jgi:predicted metal-dependent enzyme (double-stranded beta helix superfamily)
MYKVEVGDEVKKVIENVVSHYAEDGMAGVVEYLNDVVNNPDAIRRDMPNFDCDEVLLYVDDNVTAYYIATTPQINYPPHEHAMEAVAAVYGGAETHDFFDRDGVNIKHRCQVSFAAPSVIDMNSDFVHSICNLGDKPNETLHFYFGDLETQTRTMWDMQGQNPGQYDQDRYMSLATPMTKNLNN